MGQYGESVLKRLWAKIQKGGEDECWPWLGVCNKHGHGRFRIGGKLKVPHRIVWEITFGTIIAGLLVCHKCDNPPCCNPRHLFLGTQTDNMNDMYQKGRHKAWQGPTLCGHEPHRCKGLCRKCYQKKWEQENPERVRGYYQQRSLGAA